MRQMRVMKTAHDHYHNSLICLFCPSPPPPACIFIDMCRAKHMENTWKTPVSPYTMFQPMQTLDSCKHIKIELLARQTLKSRHTSPADSQTHTPYAQRAPGQLKVGFRSTFRGLLLLLSVTSLTFCYFCCLPAVLFSYHSIDLWLSRGQLDCVLAMRIAVIFERENSQ